MPNYSVPKYLGQCLSFCDILGIRSSLLTSGFRTQSPPQSRAVNVTETSGLILLASAPEGLDDERDDERECKRQHYRAAGERCRDAVC